MDFVELLQRSDPKQCAVDTDAVERHVLCEQPRDVERVHVLGRAVVLREGQVHLEEGLHIRRFGMVGSDHVLAHRAKSMRLPFCARAHRRDGNASRRCERPGGAASGPAAFRRGWAGRPPPTIGV